jgi:hypothetical protein
MNSLTGNGDFRFVIFAKGLPDVVIENFHLSDYELSEATIEQGSAFYVIDGNDELLNASGNSLGEEGNLLHIINLSSEALSDFKANGGQLRKGVEVAGAGDNYELTLINEDTEVQIAFYEGFFATQYQGSYTIFIDSANGTIYQTPGFTITRAVTGKPQIGIAGGDPVDYTTADAAESALTADQGDIIVFDEPGFAAAITLSGRAASSVALEPAENGVSNPAVGDVIVSDGGGGYQIDTSALTAGKTYKVTIVAANYAYQDDGTFKTNPVYYITLNAESGNDDDDEDDESGEISGDESDENDGNNENDDEEIDGE